MPAAARENSISYDSSNRSSSSLRSAHKIVSKCQQQQSAVQRAAAGVCAPPLTLTTTDSELMARRHQ